MLVVPSLRTHPGGSPQVLLRSMHGVAGLWRLRGQHCRKCLVEVLDDMVASLVRDRELDKIDGEVLHELRSMLAAMIDRNLKLSMSACGERLGLSEGGRIERGKLDRCHTERAATPAEQVGRLSDGALRTYIVGNPSVVDLKEYEESLPCWSR